MGRRARLQAPGTIHHVMSRGDGGKTLFANESEFSGFLAILDDVTRRTATRVLAYCLMTNHFHLLLEVGNAPLSCVMSRALTRYAKRYNKTRRRFGHVFQSRFKEKLCDSDAYFTQLLRYIHSNPVAAGLAKDAADWRWCSHRQYIGPVRSTLVDVSRALSLLADDPSRALRQYCELMSAPAPAGPLRFKAKPEQPPRKERVRPAMAELASRIESEHGFELMGVPSSRRCRGLSAGRRMLARLAIAEGYRCIDIARFLGVTPGSVTHSLCDPH